MKSALYSLAFLILIIQACTSDKPANTEQDIKIRIVEEPDRINPMLSQSSTATQIENHIFLPLIEFDPTTLNIEPILAESLPVVMPYKNGKSFTFKIREDAQWQDGHPVTGADYLFTVKAAMNPHVESRAWRAFLSEIDSVGLSENPKEFTVYMDNAFHLALETAGNFNIYPKHYYDRKGLLDAYALSDFSSDSIGGNAEKFGKNFRSIAYSRDSILGSGPYKLTTWQTNLKLSLEKVQDYHLPYPVAKPDKISYLVIPDEATALSMLKGSQLDLISSVSPTVFNALKEEARDKFEFHTPSLMQYYYLALNNTNAKLSSVDVRKALAHVLDLPKLSEVLMDGLAEPVSGPIHPSKPHYNKNLSIIKKDLTASRQFLDSAGWIDSDDDGIRDKMINGMITPLSLEILVTQRELGRNLARILKENAKEVGIEIEIVTQEWGEILKRIASRSFDIIAMARRQSPGLDDFYQSWHTSSIGPDGRNICGFGDALSDSLIMAVRTASDEDRTESYMELQKVIYDRQPVIFLFAPTETIVHQKGMDVTISSRRPGYFENTAEKN